MNEILLYAHDGSLNHGCEAIVRGLNEILREDFILFSHNPSEDYSYGINEICKVEAEGEKFKVHSPEHILLKIKSKFDTNAYYKYAYSSVLKQTNQVLFAIGGDVYCYKDNYCRMGFLNQRLREQGNKTVLFGCSIEPDLIKMDEVRNDLQRYSLIIARESITHKALQDCGITTAILLPDPAFYMEPTEADLTLPSSSIVGINLSPLVAKKNPFVLKNYERLVEYILNETNCSIALIPHVNWAHDSDLEILSKIKNKYESQRIVLIDGNLNAAQLKYCISKCSYIVTARTHVSIAAYSLCIPTIVLGYSVKAKGLAQDIYGDASGHVIDSKSLSNSQVLTDCFKTMVGNPQREKLEDYMRMANENRKQFEIEIEQLRRKEEV